MNKILVIVALCCLVVACGGVKKPPLSETQIVNGKSIVIPPEFDVVPKETKKATVNSNKPAQKSTKKNTNAKDKK